MKWYSVRKYRPHQDGYCLVRTQHGSLYTAEWSNGCEDSGADYSCGWMMLTLCEEYGAPSLVQLYGITHFCIPEPVPLGDLE